MFQAVRNFADEAGAMFRRQRSRRAVRLFFFEFTVVLLGVLAAQMLQSLSNERRSGADARLAVERLRVEAGQFRAIAEFWKTKGSCLESHVAAIASSAAAGRSMLAHEIGRPALPTPEVTGWDQGTLLAVRRAYGEDMVEAYQDLSQEASIMTDFDTEIAHEWAAFGLADSALGPPSPADWANVRLAAMRVRTQLRMQQIKSAETLNTVTRLGVKSSEPYESGAIEAAVNACGLLKNW